MGAERLAYRTCPLCEATCGLELTVNGGVSKVRGDAADVFSKGFICPKGANIGALHEDPDRLRSPLVRGADGTFSEATWEEAFALIDARLGAVLEAGGRNAVGVYIGNPAAHGLAAIVYGRVLLKAIGTRSIFSASTVDQYPKQVAAGLMFGSASSVPVPDLDRTQYLLMLGANPLASNGSLMTAPDVRGRLRAIRARGGRIVVVDPRRTRSAQEADEWVGLRPGTDALLLLAMVHVLFAEGLAVEGELLAGVDEVRAIAADFPPEAVAERCGVSAETIRRLARELAAAESGAVYGRIGTTTQSFGTVASWLVDVLNALTGNLDRPGGAMFTTPAAGAANTKGEPGRGRGTIIGRWASRVRGLPEVLGELPVAALAEEIETPGEDQIRALITIAGNPVVSTPNSERLAAAFSSLEFMVSVDIYLNETTRHADVILPAPSTLERSHYDLALYQFAVRNVANYSAPVFERPDGMPDEWETLLRLVGSVTGQGAATDIEAIDDLVALETARREAGDPHSPVFGRDPADLVAACAPRVGPDRILDLQLRCGPYGDGFGAKPEGLSLAVLEANPHGVDLGPLEPRLPEVLRTPSGKVELAPAPIVADVARLRAALAAPAPDLVLIGRRDLRSNNSWMHNLPNLVSGAPRCTVWVHPADAVRLGVAHRDEPCRPTRLSPVKQPVEVRDDIVPGVVSIPHGWGHDLPGVELGVARRHPGVNSNVLTDESDLEGVTGTAVLNGIPVTVGPAHATSLTSSAAAPAPA
jgi:anaerobic selenocysteine-containing dehydrogenase